MEARESSRQEIAERPHCDACGGAVYELMPSYCPNCERRVVNR